MGTPIAAKTVPTAASPSVPRASTSHALQLHLRQRGHDTAGRGGAAAHDLRRPAVFARDEVLIDVGAVRDHRQQRPHALQVAPGVDAADLESACGRPEERGQDAEQRGLGGPVWAEQGLLGIATCLLAAAPHTAWQIVPSVPCAPLLLSPS